MKRSHVFALLALGGLVALLLYKGPGELAATVEEFVMRALGKGELAKRATLVPAAQLALDGMRLELEETHGIQTFIGQTRRMAEEQAINIAAGRSDTANSWHLAGVDRAVDLYLVDPKTGQPDLNARLPDAQWLTMHQVAAKWGFTIPFRDLTTGKRKLLKSGKWDGGHIEYREGLTWAAAAAAAPRGVVG